jgi:mevalonate kinase
MDQDTIVGIQKMREHKPTTVYDIMDERDAYKQALQDITKAATLDEILDIAHHVLSENKS